MKKKKKTQILIVVIALVATVILTAYSYLLVKYMELPINLPFMPQQVLQKSDISDVEPIIRSWTDMEIYEPVHIDDIISSEENTDTSPEQIQIKFEELTKFDNLLDTDTLSNYLDGHLKTIENGYENMFIDEVTVENQSVGIKTLVGDDVIAIDNYDGIIMIARNFGNNSRAKLAIIKQDADIQLDIVDDLTYWEEMETNAARSKAILAINASDYVWNESYNYGKITGIVKRNGDVIRKSQNSELVVGLDENKNLIVGDESSVKSAVEGTKILIINGEASITMPEITEITNEDGTVTKTMVDDTGKREARTVIGKTADGGIVYLVADAFGEGATEAECVQLLLDYNVTDAVMLSCGNRTTMFWNGRIVNQLTGNDDKGLRLPTTWIVRSVFSENYITEESDVVETSGVSDAALNLE